MKNNLRKFLATASVAALSIAGLATGVNAQFTTTETATATGTIDPSCDFSYSQNGDLRATNDQNGDNDLNSTITLTYNCNTIQVSISETNAFTYVSSDPSNPIDINNYADINIGTLNPSLPNEVISPADTNGTATAPAVYNITNNTPGLVNTLDGQVEVLATTSTNVLPAGDYTFTKTVTLTAN